ncbi:MAG: transporter substrate-binding protein, partial [Pseudanabaena sp.]
MNQETKSLNTESNQGTNVIKVGIMHFLSGCLGAREVLVKDATLMAIAEINQSGGVLGKTIEPVVFDLSPHEQNIASQVKYFIDKFRISNLFGVGTSSARKSLIPILEKRHVQLWYPYAYEGLEFSKNVFYTGACPNQVVQPVITWLSQNKGDRIYIIGNDSIYSHTVNKIIRAQVKQQNGLLLREDYVPQNIHEYRENITKIKNTAPDIVINTLTPENSIPFLQQYVNADIKARDIPVLSLRLTEVE